MKNIELTKEEILRLYNEGSEKIKQMLIEKFSKELFSETDWMELWRKFCKEYKQNLILPYPDPNNPDEEYIDAQFMMMHIIRNKRKNKPDFNNSNEIKYNPVFDMRSSSGFGFSGSDYDGWCTRTAVGSRLCFSNDIELMKKISIEYLAIYEKIMIEP